MEENLLKYFTGNGEPTTETIEPLNIETVVTSDFLPDTRLYIYSLISNDGNYFIRYGGYPRTDQLDVSTIDVFTINSIKNEEVILSFNNLKINNHGFVLRDLHQAKDGMFYGIGNYIDENINSYFYLIIFNNFIQDGEIYINKYYTLEQMGIPSNKVILKVIKRENTGEYYLLSNSQNIYKFKIDIVEGNKLETYNFTTTSDSGTYSHNLSILNNKLIYLISFKVGNNIGEIVQYIDKKLVINIDEEPQNNYNMINIRTFNKNNNILLGSNVKNYKYYDAYLLNENNEYYLIFNITDLNGITRTYPTNIKYNGTENLFIGFSDNYMTVTDETNNKLKIFHYDFNNINSMNNYYSLDNFTGSFSDINVLKQFNIETLVGLNSKKSLVYSKNIYSVGYSSIPYYNNNFMIPQYLNLYSASNDNTSLVFSRDASNRFVAGNQLTAMFNIPNYLLNNETIHREIVNGQTNLAIENDTKTYSKNRFESLYMTYMYNMYIKDNTNGDNLINMEGSNRIANSVWQELDYQASPCLKARITYQNPNEDTTSEIITLSTPTISGTTATYTFQVVGNVIKIEYLSNDENTVYATYRCKLTGTNTITQTIEVEEG